jgi:hypothetical protein
VVIVGHVRCHLDDRNIPWLIFRQTLPPEPAAERFVWSGTEFVRAVSRLPVVTKYLLLEAANPLSWGLIWLLWLVVSVMKWRHIHGSPMKYLYLIVLGGLLIDVLVVALAPIGNVKRAFFDSRTLARLLFHFAPLAIFLTTYLIAHEGHEANPDFSLSFDEKPDNQSSKQPPRTQDPSSIRSVIRDVDEGSGIRITV